MIPAGALRTAPLAGETAFSLLRRAAARYGMTTAQVLPWWSWANHPPRQTGTGPRPDTEVLLDRAGQQVLARLCGVPEQHLARALPSWPHAAAVFGEETDAARPRARWELAPRVAGPVALACRRCAARRTGRDEEVLRYLPRWRRVCLRHQYWQPDAHDGQGPVVLDVSGCPEIGRAQRRWEAVARRAQGAGHDAGRVFAMAHTVVARWWEQALYWDEESIWPDRLHRVAGGSAGERLGWWRAVGRDAVTLPETVAVAGALVDPVLQEMVWADAGGTRGVRPLGPDGRFVARLGELVARPWLGPLAGDDCPSALYDFMGVVVRTRRWPMPPGASGTAAYGYDPFFLRREWRPPSMAGQLRQLAEQEHAAQELASRQEAARRARWGPGGNEGEAFTDRRGRRGRAYYRRAEPS
ncbi:TniQ family protein [Streptomyces albicerus]|uniref:TniQ family protein n=1 Tax=Streptomyces albicerus TaxID=2569859 RepID=UPI001788C30F|nr:TniQ family protein [Streptomyces albicerus]